MSPPLDLLSQGLSSHFDNNLLELVGKLASLFGVDEGSDEVDL